MTADWRQQVLHRVRSARREAEPMGPARSWNGEPGVNTRPFIYPFIALSAACSSQPTSNEATEATEADQASAAAADADRPPIHRHRTRDSVGDSGAQCTGGALPYNGGDIMNGGPLRIYFIWYGDWRNSPARPILTDWAGAIGGSRHFAINSSYYSSSGGNLTGLVSYGGSFDDWYSQGTSLSDINVGEIVQNALANGLPGDENGIYFVLSSADVDQGSGFCSSYCGWHSAFFFWSPPLSIEHLKFAWVGDASQRCPTHCEAQTESSPNGNPGADAMVSVMTHELEESMTDPYGTAWRDSGGCENGDRCAWTFGAKYAAANGSQANVHLGNRDYLIQQNWLVAGNVGCTLSYAYNTLPFDQGDTRMTTRSGDWRLGSFKAECGASGVLTGLSRSPSDANAHAALCRDDPSYAHQSCHTVAFAHGDHRYDTATGDWDSGYFKGECGAAEYVAGVSQTPAHQVDAILCCAAPAPRASCTARVFANGDSRASGTDTGDWDYGDFKGECGAGHYVAGVSRSASSDGAPHAILCCGPG
jgi:hypothetical protein